jgi:methionyl aminopeptidase
MISIKSEQEIELMRKSGKITYGALCGLRDFIKPGVTTKDIDKFVHDYIVSHDATPSFLGYEGFPATACVSINDMVVHGIPDNTKLKNGDIVSVDVGSIYKGYHSDSAYTYIVGDVDSKVNKFVLDTQKALYDGISVIKEGIKLNEVCKAIEHVARENGYGVFECLTGHGVGRELHEDPFIPNLSNHESEGIILKSGMTLAIEPMFSLGTKNVWLLDDEWGIVTQDGSLAAHFEHTILVTKDGYEILTGE